MDDPLWQDIPAVKNDRVFLMPTSFVSYDRFSVELPLMLDYTANVMYPDEHTFGGIDELREFVHSAPSAIDGKIKEGIVFRTKDGQDSFKCVDPEFLAQFHQ